MTDHTPIINAIVKKQMETVTSEPYDVVDAALMEESYRRIVTEVLQTADEMGFLAVSDYLQGMQDGIEVSKEQTAKTKTKLDEVWKAAKEADETELRTTVLSIIEN